MYYRMRRSLVITSLAACACLYVPGGAMAYERETHKLLTEKAVGQSESLGDMSLLRELEIRKDSQLPASTGVLKGISDLLMLGASYEDGCVKGSAEEPCTDGAPGKNNVFNHFFDPQAGWIPLRVACDLGSTSVEWATEVAEQIERPGISLCGAVREIGSFAPQRFSYQDALGSFLAALIDPSPEGRELALGRTFQTLGHVVHHLQDMHQPDHVRNDLHCGESVCLDFPLNAVGLRDPSTLEKYTDIDVIRTGVLKPMLDAFPYARRVMFSAPQEFWKNPNASGAADYTSNNFISPDTNFRGPIADPLPDPDHPRPDPVFGPGSPWRIMGVPVSKLRTEVRGLQLPKPPADGLLGGVPDYSRLPDAEVQFIVRDVPDPYTGLKVPDVRISAFSIFTTDLEKVRTRTVQVGPPTKEKPSNKRVAVPIYTTNHLTVESFYRPLLPRAVAFSAGLIDFFFRGRIALEVTDGTFFVANTSAPGNEMLGQLQLFFQDRNGIRTRIDERQVSLAPGEVSRALSFDTSRVPGDPRQGKFVAVFVGIVGEYEGLAVSSAVLPGTPCGVPIMANGGTEGFFKRFELGAEAGPVQIEFDAFTIPDGLSVAIPGGRNLLFRESVTGFNAFSFQHNPESSGSTGVDVRVTGNKNTETRWVLSVGCPNQPAASIRTNVRFTIAVSQHMCSAGTEFLVDGERVSDVNGNFSGFTGKQLTPGRHEVALRGSCTPIDPNSPFARFEFTYDDGKGVRPVSFREGVIEVR